VYNLHQHIKNDTDSTDVVENDYRKKVISTEMQQIGNKKVIHRRTREIIFNTFD
jgi:hypothetical protein